MVEKSLTDPLFALPPASFSQAIKSLRDVVDNDSSLFATRVAQGRIIEGHGDLRPEHVYLGAQTLVIDCLEFDERLRWLDPFDEAAFLGMECERLGAAWIGPHLVACLSLRLQDTPPPRLLRFYRCYRACLRASLSIEHLRDPRPRTPDKWPRQTREYLAFALASLP
jgi:aminoglycoside phosphotransferase family enzyme